jgi:hypothetical protein
VDIFFASGSLDHPLTKRCPERRILILPDSIEGRVLRFHKRCPFGPGEYPEITALYCGIFDGPKVTNGAGIADGDARPLYVHGR